VLGNEVSVLSSVWGPDSSSLYMGGKIVAFANLYWSEKVVGTEGKAYASHDDTMVLGSVVWGVVDK
jgi:hypothetical protein